MMSKGKLNRENIDKLPYASWVRKLDFMQILGEETHVMILSNSSSFLNASVIFTFAK